MLGLDALAKRACLAAIVGLILAGYVSWRWAALAAVAVLYLLLMLRADKGFQWPSP